MFILLFFLRGRLVVFLTLNYYSILLLIIFRIFIIGFNNSLPRPIFFIIVLWSMSHEAWKACDNASRLGLVRLNRLDSGLGTHLFCPQRASIDNNSSTTHIFIICLTQSQQMVAMTRFICS